MRSVKEVSADMKAIKRQIAAVEASLRKATENAQEKISQLQERGRALAAEYEAATAAQARAFADSLG